MKDAMPSSTQTHPSLYGFPHQQRLQFLPGISARASVGTPSFPAHLLQQVVLHRAFCKGSTPFSPCSNPNLFLLVSH